MGCLLLMNSLLLMNCLRLQTEDQGAPSVALAEQGKNIRFGFSPIWLKANRMIDIFIVVRLKPSLL